MVYVALVRDDLIYTKWEMKRQMWMMMWLTGQHVFAQTNKYLYLALLIKTIININRKKNKKRKQSKTQKQVILSVSDQTTPNID